MFTIIEHFDWLIRATRPIVSGMRRTFAAALLAPFLGVLAIASVHSSTKSAKPGLPKSYLRARPFVELSPEELMKKIPDLKGMEPAATQVSLSAILENVGKNVQAFFHNFMNTASVENIYQIRSSFNGEESLDPIRTNYLLLGVQDRTGVHLQEYRTNSKGRPTVVASGRGRGLLTHGFASVSVYFEPLRQAGENFRYLGNKIVDGHKYLLIAFAQHAEPEQVLAQFSTSAYSIPILVQGVAWIDPEKYQIARMRTDLLAPLARYDLDQLTTDITYNEVSFKGGGTPMWLPREVVVTVKYQNTTFHNVHRYSDYRLFNVEAGSKAKNSSPESQPE